MAKFDKQKYIDEKIKQYAPSIVGLASGTDDPIKLTKDLTDLFRNTLETIIDNSVENETQADKEFRKLQSKRIGMMVNSVYWILLYRK